MKLIYIIFFITLSSATMAQNTITGTVVSETDGSPLAGVSIAVKGGRQGTSTGKDGKFSLAVPVDADTLVVSLLGYHSRQVLLQNMSGDSFIIALAEDATRLEEVVVSTGYYSIPRERATGSFTFINNELLNRSVSTDIISRLEGVANSLSFDRRLSGTAYGDDLLSLRIRGQSTLSATAEAPLIVVDDFPYEGDIGNINPNDVESVTILKDAAAASIWGARAGNGVIVITTKKGRLNQPVKISFNSNLRIAARPDLFYNPNFLTSSEFIDLEKELFQRGFYNGDETSSSNPVLSPVVETLIQQRDGSITAAEAEARLSQLGRQDIRRDAEKYLYRNSIRQQYALNFSGGFNTLRYFLSAGYDYDQMSLVGNHNNRITLNSSTIFSPVKNLDVTAGIAYMQKKFQNNGLGLLETGPSGDSPYPYTVLADENGNPLPTPKDYRKEYIAGSEEMGLLDWQYRPLEEITLRDYTSKDSEVRINTALNYDLTKGLDIELKYQYQKIAGTDRRLDHSGSYYVRNLVNRYTQEDGTRIFPEGGILDINRDEITSHSARGQLNYEGVFREKHRLSALGGMEIRERHSSGDGLELYGYDNDVLTWQSQFDYETRYPVRPIGTARIPLPSPLLSDLTDRFISYYSNVSYSYDDRYILSGSARWDASNLFGVETNQKGVPLWSIGGSWYLSNEKFYNLFWLPQLKLRLTYGYNGNIDNSLTAFTTARYTTESLTDLKTAFIVSPGNAELRWEKVGVFNAGIDFGLRNDRITGSLEYYTKTGKDLIGEIPIDPTKGYLNGTYTNLLNYAGTETKGFDAEIQTINIDGPFRWRTNLLVSLVRDKVTEYREGAPPSSVGAAYIQYFPTPVVGKPKYAVYSYPWYGLESETGDPLVAINGEQSKDYSTYLRELAINDLVYHGSAIPTFFGSIRNTFSWKKLQFSANITWKGGYFFRRSSVSYQNLINSLAGHRDFSERWKKPGDELFTQVPSIPSISSSLRDQVYNLSEILIEKGDHIRIQDISLSYDLDKRNIPGMPIQNIRFYLYWKNPGIIWKATDFSLDPEAPLSMFPSEESLAFGVAVNF